MRKKTVYSKQKLLELVLKKYFLMISNCKLYYVLSQCKNCILIKTLSRN